MTSAPARHQGLSPESCRYIDFHTHAFPAELAANTIPALETFGNVTAALDGSTADLLRSMARADINQSVICSIATRPQQFQAILDWSQKIASEHLIPLASIHPDSTNIAGEIGQIKEAGLAGIKLHPYYQEFYLDEARLKPIFQGLSDNNLLLVMHCGYDIGFPHERRADPKQLSKLIRQFPQLKLVAAHLGSWQLWDEVEEVLLGQDIYLDIAFALQFLKPEQARRILTSHRADRLLLGSDSPWADQGEVISLLTGLGLAKELEEKILWQNGRALLDSIDQTTKGWGDD